MPAEESPAGKDQGSVFPGSPIEQPIAAPVGTPVAYTPNAPAFFHIAEFRRQTDRIDTHSAQMERRVQEAIQKKLSSAQESIGSIAEVAATPIIAPLETAVRLHDGIEDLIRSHIVASIAPVVALLEDLHGTAQPVPPPVTPAVAVPVQVETRPPPQITQPITGGGTIVSVPHGDCVPTDQIIIDIIPEMVNCRGQPWECRSNVMRMIQDHPYHWYRWIKYNDWLGSESDVAVPSWISEHQVTDVLARYQATIRETREWDSVIAEPGWLDSNANWNGFYSLVQIPPDCTQIEPPPPPPPPCRERENARWVLYRHRYKPGECLCLCEDEQPECPQLWERLDDYSSQELCEQARRCDPRCQCQPDTKIWICNPQGGTQECPPPNEQDLCGVGVYQHQVTKTCMDDFRNDTSGWYGDFWDSITGSDDFSGWQDEVVGTLVTAGDTSFSDQAPEYV